MLVQHVAAVSFVRVTEQRKQGRFYSESYKAKGERLLDSEGMSPSEKRTRFGLVTPMMVAGRPDKVKPATEEEATNQSPVRALRGERGGRVLRELPRNLGELVGWWVRAANAAPMLANAAPMLEGKK
ncbi:MAG: hypothetical protein ACRD1R_08800 [Acidobacteriota bacterium]